MAAAVVLALLAPQRAAAAPYWAVVGQSAQARSIQSLFWIVIAVAFVFLVGVEGALLFVVFRFRARPGDGDAPQLYGNRRLEVWWTVIPGLILV
ncbi:MAG: cytochrome c oxidase subunit II, partial [Chloroflexota bacterium]|nr:cytochrome c oxidase subunit II [Chloroflexota bacterium]